MHLTAVETVAAWGLQVVLDNSAVEVVDDGNLEDSPHLLSYNEAVEFQHDAALWVAA